MHIHAAVGGRKRPTDYKYYRPPAGLFFPLNLRRRLVLPNFFLVPPFLFLLFAYLVAEMARSALSALVALASLTLVAGQSTAAPTQSAANGVPSLPATPLVSEIYAYTALVRISCR
jgi:hypothetical protein